MLNIEQPVVGWKEIAFIFNESVDACRAKFKKSLKTGDPMPVIKSGRVKGYSSELRAWLSRQSRPNCGRKAHQKG